MSKQNSTPPSGGGKEDQKKTGAETKAEHKNENKGHASTGGGGGGKVVSLSGGCLAEGCKKKVEKAGFCMEHFDWFKEGLITKEGKKPSDFDKKHFAYMNRKRPAA